MGAVRSGFFAVHDAAAGGHPLRVADLQHAMTAVVVAMLDLALEDERHRLESAMGMVAERSRHEPVLGEHQERIELRPVSRLEDEPHPVLRVHPGVGVGVDDAADGAWHVNQRAYLKRAAAIMKLLMKDHQAIDRRSLSMARRIVAKIDEDPSREGLAHARRVCERWLERGNVPAREWIKILDRPWSEIRVILLDDSEESRRLRQNDPFCGILTPLERWDIYREASIHEAQ